MPESRDIAEVLDDLQLHVRCTLHASPEEREEEYVRLFISGPIREDPILDAYLHEDRAYGTAGDEEPDDIFEQVREDDPLCSLVAHDEHEAGQSSLAVAHRAPLWRSRPCCEHKNMPRQILEQIKKLTDQVDELKRKFDRSEERRQCIPHFHREYMDDDRGVNWDGADELFDNHGQMGAEEANDREADTGIDRTGQKGVEEPVDVDVDVETTVDGKADTAVRTGVGPTVEVTQEEVVDTGVDTTVDGAQVEAVITGVDTPVEGEAEVANNTGIGKMVEGDAEKADQPRIREKS
ncbi:Uncharacterized protein Fot_11039 [Forsythia ovata]|uniref:Uncharacterized protein n=1 Tax=Forsythia ovata TaxID=205694 RepID=A0ABD1WIJ6_9LAMI